MPLNPEHFLKIAEGVIERGYKINFWAYARVDTIKEEYLQKLKQAGFNWLALGIESASEDVRAGAEKGRFNQTDIREIVRKIKDAGINSLVVEVQGFGDGREAAIRGLASHGIRISSVRDSTAVSHGGCKLPKKRRL